MTTGIDLFAGAGGFTAGAQEAGVDVLWAANHWPEAVDVHSRNHPGVDHSCQDLMQADWSAVPDHDLLLASPCCQGHSSASQPKRLAKHDADRATAWAVIMCAEARRPSTILVENVRPFLRWALLPSWLDAFQRLGYHTRTHLFDTASFGVPQNRQRVIVSARLGAPLELQDPERDALPAASFIDWDHADGWAPVSTKPVGVMRRHERARRKGLSTYLMHYSSDHSGRAIDRPIGTITTKNQWALVRDGQIRMLTTGELAAAMGFPAGYQLPRTKKEAVRMLGNAIPVPFAAELVRQAAA